MGESRDEACAELLTAGRPEDDEGLFERLSRCLGRDLQRHALRRCGNPADAEDAVQDAMAAALRYLTGFRGETSLRSWLLRLVSTACIHQRRGRRNDPKLHSSIEEGSGPGSVLADPGAPADESLLLEERLRRVARALESLPEGDRLLLLRHEGEEVPLAELALQTGQSVAAIRTRLFRLRKLLRSQLETVDEADSPTPVDGSTPT